MKSSRRAALTAATVSTMNAHGNTVFLSRMKAVPPMLRDTATGRYDGLGKGRLLAMCLALAYLVSPVDLLPEALLTIPGLVDDAGIAVWLLAIAMHSADDYLAETSQVPVHATATIIEEPTYLSR